MEERPILIVEDNERERELIASALTGYELSQNVMALTSGSELMNYVERRGEYHGRRGIPSLIILDLDLPDVHGLELLKKIRQSGEMGNVPVVIFSGSDSALDAAVARELRADGFIVKPSSFQDLQATVRSLAVFWASQVRANTPMGIGNND